MRLVASLVLASSLMLAGCAHNKPLPVGALNTFDAASYDTLMEAQATLVVLKTHAPELDAQVPQFKEYLNTAIIDYNAAEDAWKVYHNSGGSSAAVTAALTTLTVDLLKVQGIIPSGGK